MRVLSSTTAPGKAGGPEFSFPGLAPATRRRRPLLRGAAVAGRDTRARNKNIRTL
jgi:hypothetical protein